MIESLDSGVSMIIWLRFMQRLIFSILGLFLCLESPLALAGGFSNPSLTESSEEKVSQESLRRVQQDLINPAARQKILNGDSKAKEQDKKVQGLLGNDSEKAYEISAELIETIHKKAGGDPVKMEEMVNELRSNPMAIEKYLSSQQKDKIRKMANEVEAQQKSVTIPGRGH